MRGIITLSIALFLFLGFGSNVFASTITVTPDHGTSGGVTLVPSGFTWVGDTGGDLTGNFPTCSFYFENGDFAYVSGNCEQSSVAWFADYNGHGSGGTTFTDGIYKIVAWTGTFVSGTLLSGDECYGTDFATCVASDRYITSACYNYNGSSGCTLGVTPPPPPPPPPTDLKPTISTIYFSYFSTTTCSGDSSSSICVTSYATDTPFQTTSQDEVFLLSIIIFLISPIWLTLIYSIFKPKKQHGLF